MLEAGKYELRVYVWQTAKPNVKPDKIFLHTFLMDEDSIKYLKAASSAAKKGEPHPYITFGLDGAEDTSQILSLEMRKKLFNV